MRLTEEFKALTAQRFGVLVELARLRSVSLPVLLHDLGIQEGAVGLFLAQSVHLSKIGMKIPGAATHKSKERRVQRIVDNPAIRACSWYAPWIAALLEQIVARGLPVRLIVDGSKVGFGHQLLIVAVVYRRRAIPVAWTWAKGSRGHSSSWKQLALLSYVRGLIPAGATVSLSDWI